MEIQQKKPQKTHKHKSIEGNSQLVLSAQSTTKDYIRAEHKLQYISKLFIARVIVPQVCLAQSTAQIISTISERRTRKTIIHVLEPIYIPGALNTGTCIQQGDLFYSADLYRNRCQPQLTQEKLGRTGEQTGRVEINKEEILGSRRSIHGYILTHSRL